MIIAGAKGFANTILEILIKKVDNQCIYLFDDVSAGKILKIWDKFPVVKSLDDVKRIFEYDNRFVLGLGGTMSRYLFSEKLKKNGGKIESVISKNCIISDNKVNLSQGISIMDQVNIENNVSIGECTLINTMSLVAHDSIIGSYSEISPGSKILGRCKIGDFTTIGSGSIVLPDIKIGNNVIVGAGSVVINNIKDNSVVVGVPAKYVKKNN